MINRENCSLVSMAGKKNIPKLEKYLLTLIPCQLCIFNFGAFNSKEES